MPHSLAPFTASLEEQLADKQAVRLLTKVYRFLLFFAVPALMVTLAFQKHSVGWSWVIIVELALIALGMRACLQRGRARTAIQVMQWSFLIAISVQCLLVNGIRTPVVMAYPILLMMSGWWLGRRAAYAMLAISLLWLTAISVLNDTFWSVLLVRETSVYWVTAVIVCCMSTLLAVHVAESNRRKHEAERHVAEELTRRLEQLQEARDKLATLFHLNPIPVSVSRVEDGTYTDANPAWARISGWSRGEMIGKTSTELGIWVTPQDRDAFVDVLRRHGHTFNYLAPFRMRDGEVRYFLLNSELVEYDGYLSIFSAFVDITERRAAEESLGQLNAELEQRVAERTHSLSETLDTLRRAQDELVQSDKLASLGSLVAGVAHELNTPIGNAVLIASTLTQDMHSLEEAYQGGELRKSALEAFISDAGRAASLLDQSLSQARDLISSFKQVAIDQSSERRRAFGLAALGAAKHLRRRCDRACAMATGEVGNESGGRSLQMDSYPGPLGQVITNLVQNAFFHGLQEHVPGVVRIETRALDETHIEISVSDDGHGIPAENLGRIFDPFFTTRRWDSRYSGTWSLASSFTASSPHCSAGASMSSLQLGRAPVSE